MNGGGGSTGRTLTVSGHGKIFAEPDRTVLNFSVVGRDRSYAASVEDLNRRVEALRGDLEASGVERGRLKTGSFEVGEDNYVRRKGKGAARGYAVSHRLRLELPAERGLLNSVLGRMEHSASEARVSVSFAVSDPEALRRRAMEAAVADAFVSARILAEASGVSLGAVLRVDYHHVDVRVRFADPSSYDLAAASPPPDVQPEALRAEESVTVVWAFS